MKHIFDSHSHYTDKAFDDDRDNFAEAVLLTHKLY